MKNFFIILFFFFVLTLSAKANPWLVLESIGIGAQVLEAGVEKIKDVNNSRKNKKKIKNQKKYLSKGSKIITFLG